MATESFALCFVCVCVCVWAHMHASTVVHTGPLANVFIDVIRMRSEEIQTLSGVDEFGEFYRRLKQLKDYHRKFADDVSH